MQYICVEWLHDFLDEPVIIYSENDDGGWETRKVEVFADGRCSYASSTEQKGDSELAEVTMPSLEEIASQKEFRPRSISRREFEAIWAMARQKSNGRARLSKREAAESSRRKARSPRVLHRKR